MLAAIVPLAFVAVLFDPYLLPKEVLLETGTALLVLLWIAEAWPGGVEVALTAAVIPLSCLALAAALPALWQWQTFGGWNEARRLGFAGLLYLVALSRMRSAGARAALAAAVITAGTVEAIYVLVQYRIGDPLVVTEGLHGKWRTFGTLGNPNWTGEFLAMAALVGLGFCADEGRTRSGRRWTAAATLLILVAMAATFARGAWLGCACGAAGWLWARRRMPGNRRWILWVGAATVICCGAAVFAVTGSHWAAHDLFNLKSVRGRFWMWMVSWEMIRDAPWMGHGPGTFGMTFPLYQARAFPRPWAAGFIGNASFASHAHSDYLQTWAETGLLGLLGMAALGWIVLRRGRRAAPDSVALGCRAALVSMLVNALIAFPFHLPASLALFAVLLGAVEAANSKRTIRIQLRSRWAAAAAGAMALALCVTAGSWSWRQLAADAALRHGSMALRAGHWSDAEAYAAVAIRNAPERPEGYLLRGRLGMEEGRYQEAVSALDQAMRLDYDPRTFQWKAAAQIKSGQTAAGLATIHELTRLRPDLRKEGKR